jgi:hypothetical protein
MSVENLTAQIEKLSKWAGENSEQMERYRSMIAIIVGLLTMYFTYQLGNTHFYLLIEGVRAEGRIVEYKQQAFVNSSRSSSTIFVPVIEFQTGYKVVRFKDWLGNQSNSASGEVVPVIYNATDPSIAMVDRPTWNWIPFSVFIAGLLLVLVSIKNWFKFGSRKA